MQLVVAVSLLATGGCLAADQQVDDPGMPSGEKTDSPVVVGDGATRGDVDSTARVVATEPAADRRLDAPEASGSWPDAGSTGLRDPGLLKPSGSVTVTTNGAVIENLDIKGMITIKADNVTVRNVRVTSNGEKYLISIASGRSGTVIEDVELNGRRVATHGIVHGGYTARRVNMYAVGDGFRAGSNTLIEDSWVHDLGHDSAHDPSPHFDAVQLVGGTNITIRNNRLEGPWRGQTSAILMLPYAGTIGDVLVENNKLSGGTFTLFVLLPGEGTWGGGVSAPYDPARPVTVRNNTFVYDSAQYGPLSDSKIPMKPQPYLVFDGNTYDTNGLLVYPGMPNGYYPTLPR
jgi:hypothetical protein